VGSEGTLAFLAEATMKTVIDYPFKTSAMLYFPTMRSACEAVIKLKKSPVTAVEMFDRLALKSVEDKPDAIPELKTLPSDAAVLLIKTEADKEHILEQNINEIASVIQNLTPSILPDSRISNRNTMLTGLCGRAFFLLLEAPGLSVQLA